MITSLNLINMVYENYYRSVKTLRKTFDKHANWRKQAKLLKLSRDACLRLEWLIYYETKANGNASLTCRHFGISGKTFHKWKNRFEDKNLRLLEDEGRAPKHVRQKEITAIEEARIIALRKQHIRWGKMKLAVLYERMHKEKISSWKIQYTIVKYRLYFHPVKNARTQKKRLRAQNKKRITELKTKPFSGYLIALDTIVVYSNNTKRYILTAIDVVSKIAFARMYTSKSSANAADFLQRFFFLTGGSFLNSLNDNGSEFHKEFIKACERLEIEQYWSRNRTPKDNPVCERFNRTVREEFLQLGNFTTDTIQFNERITEWLIEYNFVRPHQTLNYATPWEVYQSIPKVKPKQKVVPSPFLGKVLPMYPSSTKICKKSGFLL